MAAIPMTPRFILAKYVPDLSRMEPRNIGVFLWSKGRICSKFLDERDADFINDKETYGRWLRFWESKVSADEVKTGHSPGVPISDPGCMDALIASQEGQYLLVDAGELLAAVPRRETQQATDFLFGELVALKGVRESGTATSATSGFADRCARVFHRSGLASREDFKERYSIECPVYGVPRHLRFSYGLGNGKPDSLFQVAKLTSEQSVNSAALMLHTVIDNAVVSRKRCGALVRGTDVTNELADEGRQLLAGLCEVIDVDDEQAAAERVSELVKKRPRVRVSP